MAKAFPLFTHLFLRVAGDRHWGFLASVIVTFRMHFMDTDCYMGNKKRIVTSSFISHQSKVPTSLFLFYKLEICYSECDAISFDLLVGQREYKSMKLKCPFKICMGTGGSQLLRFKKSIHSIIKRIIISHYNGIIKRHPLL